MDYSQDVKASDNQKVHSSNEDKSLDLYNKVKVVNGEKFVTIEDTNKLTTEEMKELISNIIEEPAYVNIPNVNIKVNDKFPDEIDQFLRAHEFDVHDEIVTVHKKLEKEVVESKPHFLLHFKL
ncbi:hypothetical protein [Pseudalkalibacillus decolorationis]|uniref:hypothetical protein n=1 Tax=Pseudalkalibacillus decolorationis TaxID=163879 RepID=UPI00214876FC|nr:hypothetical protein [Pseudalkalibacillus decolorationis]